MFTPGFMKEVLVVGKKPDGSWKDLGIKYSLEPMLLEDTYQYIKNEVLAGPLHLNTTHNNNFGNFSATKGSNATKGNNEMEEDEKEEEISENDENMEPEFVDSPIMTRSKCEQLNDNNNNVKQSVSRKRKRESNNSAHSLRNKIQPPIIPSRKNNTNNNIKNGCRSLFMNELKKRNKKNGVVRNFLKVLKESTNIETCIDEIPNKANREIISDIYENVKLEYENSNKINKNDSKSKKTK
eukprot:UN30685